MDKNCDGLVLCGGRSRRFAGRDKGLMPIGQENAAERALRLLRPHCSRLIVSANRHLQRYAAIPGVAVMSDRRSGHAGPLAALETLDAVGAAARILMLPCDLPALDPRVPGLLLHALDSDSQIDVVYARAGQEHQYLCAALRKDSLKQATALLNAGHHAVRRWLRETRSADLDIGPELASGLRNSNRPQDWPTPTGPRVGSMTGR